MVGNYLDDKGCLMKSPRNIDFVELVFRASAGGLTFRASAVDFLKIKIDKIV